MTDAIWKKFFLICNDVLGKGHFNVADSENWCSWTTYSRLHEDAGYWTSGLPNENEITDNGILDGGTWGQPFLYQDIAHIIIPKQFYWETPPGPGFDQGNVEQDIEKLSSILDDNNIEHSKTELLLEIKLY